MRTTNSGVNQFEKFVEVTEALQHKTLTEQKLLAYINQGLQHERASKNYREKIKRAIAKMKEIEA